MDFAGIAHKFPQPPSLVGKTPDEKKQICEELIQEAINQIHREQRSATKWEIDALSQAIAQILYGRYDYSITEVIFSTKTADEVARPDYWWKEGDDIDLDKLQFALDHIKGYGFPIKNIVPERSETDFDTDHFVGELAHPKDDYWWQHVDTYKSDYCGTSLIVPFWEMIDPVVLHLSILYGFSIVVRYLPETWHEVEYGSLDHIRSLLEHYLVVVDNVLPKLAVERLTRIRLLIAQPGGLNAPV